MKCNKISNGLKFVSCVSDKLFKFSVYELLKFHLYAILPCTCGSYNIVLICHFLCTHTHIHTHTHTYTHTHTHTDTHTHIHDG